MLSLACLTRNTDLRICAARKTGEANEVVEQVAFADVLLVNKTDLVTSENELKEVERELRSINSHAQIVRSNQSRIDISKVLSIDAFDLDRIGEKLLEEKSKHQHGHGHGHSHSHSHYGIEEVSLVYEGGMMDYEGLNNFVGSVLSDKDNIIYRCKGIVATSTTAGQDRQKLVFQGVGHHFQGEVIGEYASTEDLHSRLVFIGKGLCRETFQAEFDKCKI